VAIPHAALDRRLDPPLEVLSQPAEFADPESWGLEQAIGRLRQFAHRVDRAMADPGNFGSLADWLHERGATRAHLAKAGLPPRAASLILQGRQQPNAEQLLRISRAFDADPLALRTMLGTLPGGLLAELHRPHRRAQVSARAAEEGLPEAQLRRDAAAAIAAPQAARRPRGSAAPDWAALVDEFFG
jgi:transcriptional regulator with XRE-family HTH domain